jgi:hypothetical protein
MHTVMVERRQLARLVALAESRTAHRLAEETGEISEMRPSPENRLLGIPTQALLDRIVLVPAVRAGFDRMARGHITAVANPPVFMSPAITEPAFSTLKSVAASPTQEDLSELSLADHFYAPKGPPPEGPYRPTDVRRAICDTRREGGRVAMPFTEGRPINLAEIRANPFFCPKAPGPWPSFFIGNVDPILYFGLDPSKHAGRPQNIQMPWGKARQIALNILNLSKVAEKYPWPGVVRAYPPAWWRVEQEGLRMLVNQDAPLTQDMIRFWITLATVADYNQIAAIVEDKLKEEAKRERFNAIIWAIGLTAIGAIIGAAIAAPLVVKGLTAGLGALSSQQKKEAADGLEDAADQLKATDPEFAKEAEWSADYLKYAIALQAMEERDAQAGLPPGTTARPRPPAAPGTGEDKGLIAAVGVAVPALFTAASAFLRA